MLRLGRASAVSAPQDLLAVAQRGYNRLRDRGDLLAIVRRVEQPGAIGKQLVEITPPVVVHGRVVPRVEGSIQKSSSPCETNSPLPGTIRTIVPASSLWISLKSFIASSTQRTSPGWTRCPTSTNDAASGEGER